MAADEEIFPTRDNVSLVLFKQGGVAIDFSLATRFVLSFGTDTIDTAIDAGTITTTATTGELEFDLGQLTLTSTGKQYATLIVFDINHQNGQVLACEADENLSFTIKEC
jgi:hypothetical protein